MRPSAGIRLPWVAALAAAILAASLASAAGEEGCARCHARSLQGRYAHGAGRLECAACHAAIDASVVPHRPGAGGKPAAVDAPGACLRCHERHLFEGSVRHAPADAGMCLVCHSPHASDQIALLRKPPATLCLDCHPDVGKTPHVTAGVARPGHPVGGDSRKPGTPVEDPLRPGRPFYCASCHEPHRSTLPYLLRMPKGTRACLECHKM